MIARLWVQILKNLNWSDPYSEPDSWKIVNSSFISEQCASVSGKPFLYEKLSCLCKFFNLKKTKKFIIFFGNNVPQSQESHFSVLFNRNYFSRPNVRVTFSFALPLRGIIIPYLDYQRVCLFVRICFTRPRPHSSTCVPSPPPPRPLGTRGVQH
jgi:hypothetical protein